MTAPARVLLVTPSYPPAVGGAASYFDGLAQQFTARGIFCHVLTVRMATTTSETQGRTVFRRIPNLLSKALAVRLTIVPIWTCLSIMSLHRRYRYTQLHVHSSTAITLGVMMASSIRRIPIAYDVQDMMARSWVLRRGYRPRYVTTGACIRRQLLSYGLPSEDIVRIMSVPPDASRGQAVSRNSRPPATRCLFVGEVRNVIKGVDVLLRAFAELRTHIPAATLTLIGAGPDMATDKILARKLGLAEVVTWCGNRPHDEVLRQMDQADILLVPSHTEGVPRVILEAFARGTIVIASRVGGVPEAVIDGRTGRLVPPNDSQALAQSMRRVMNDPALQSTLRAGASAWLAQQPTWPDIATQILSLYTT